ncbi:VPXXXP-CTERM sorting domain-containing protein [Methanohalophilus sp. RSK]|uniref:VPXXXP-CTERM sorting domain-containing protein n=1 Tax=Methanohalophilus sp. RSK TaxID=2485783 RepID=UPI000F43CB9A|nr:VPXXXP-CTERM sorting domain-containing protein [Methanohalophilus sp. RSK]RNI14649.1 VPXXXP-CTERM sorting domain-containing protein [Methanohalophilus sp. RSK]
MKQMRIVLAICAALMLMIAIPAASAITVDGYKSAAEWDENWAFGQNNNVSHAYNPNGPFGDRMEVRQGGVNTLVTSEWNMVDPKNDSGGDFDESMASAGESSGSDIGVVYAHYEDDTLYGLSEVYGIPGDYDGDGDVSQANPDTVGSAGPAGSGLGSGESWTISLYQDSKYSIITVGNNDWDVESNTGMTYSDIDARLSNDAGNSVYEIGISNFSNYFTIAPGAEFEVELAAGATPDDVGEDFGTLIFQIPEPDIMIKKYVSPDNSTWYDAQTQASGPILDNSSDVYWRYNVTNIGNEPLVSVNVTDNKEGFICDIGDLAVSETEVCYYSGTVPDPCVPYANVGTTNGIGSVTGIPVTDNDPAHYNCEEKPPNGNGVPALTPIGLVALIGMLGFVALRRRD